MSCSSYFDFTSVTLYTILVLGALKIYNNVTKGIYKGNERLEGKTVIITGASAGIGAECAKDLARRGARVLMVCRDMTKGEKVRQEIINWTGNRNVILKHVDFASLESTRKCANEILAEEPRIDILLNNAGASGLGFNNKTADGLEILMQTNHFGPFLFTNILLGKIKENPSARIVNLSSVMHKWAYFNMDDINQEKTPTEHGIYCNSKLANNFFNTALAEKLKGTGITVNCLNPGEVKSDITRTKSKVFTWMLKFIKETFFKTTWEGAQTSIFLCVSPSVEKVTGKYFADCKEDEPNKESLDLVKAAKFWDLSVEAVKLKDSEKHY